MIRRWSERSNAEFGSRPNVFATMARGVNGGH